MYCTPRWDSSLSVRAFACGGMGCAYMSGLDERLAREVGINAARLAKAAEPDPDFVSLPEPIEYPTVEGTYDEAIETLDTHS